MDQAQGQAAGPLQCEQAALSDQGWEGNMYQTSTTGVPGASYCACTLHKAWQDAAGHTRAS